MYSYDHRKTAYRPRVVMPRDFYLPKEVRDQKPYVPRGTDQVVYQYDGEDRNGRPKYVAIAFQGKSQKPLYHYSFRSEAQREKHIEDSADGRRRTLEEKERRKKERREFKHEFNVGDILYSAWGYDQTNVDFYEVTRLAGAKQIEIREIAQKVARRAEGADYVVAVPGRYTGPPKRKRVSPGHSVRLTSYSHAYKWDGKPKYQTAWGYGH